jgi:hypothetical protein
LCAGATLLCLLAPTSAAAQSAGAALPAERAPAADDDAAGEQHDGLDQPLLGAAGPALGDVVLYGSLGAAMFLPQVELAGRVGSGAGSSVELGYRNLAAFGNEGRLRLAWGGAVNDWLDVGVAARGSYTTLAAAGDGFVGIQFQNLSLGNDLELGNDLLLSFRRPGAAHITASAGPTFTLGGTRFVHFDESETFQLDPALRAIHVSVQGEWSWLERVNVVLRLDGMFLMGVEVDEQCVQARQQDCGQPVPFGFLPTGTVGVAWAL